MIKSLLLKNFKSIKEYSFSLRNLNIMVGLNGMGKSTFIQSLLLLRQSRNLSKGELLLNDELVKIGKSKDAFYQYSKEDSMCFKIEFEDLNSQRFDFAYLREADYFEATTEGETPVAFFNQSLFNKGFQYLNANRLEPKVIHDKSYDAVEVQKALGIFGQFTVHFLEKYGEDDISLTNLIHPKSETFELGGETKVDSSLLSQVNNWLGEISPGIKLSTSEIPNSDNVRLDIQYKQRNLGFTEKFRPTNVGFGISYALPVVTALLSAESGDLIIIENPESHIHPRGQVELGKLIALASHNNVQIIIETHSDHIFNGIRVAVKENPELSNRVAAFYFERTIEETEQYSNVSEIKIDKNGELSYYPENLLNEWSNQLLKLI